MSSYIEAHDMLSITYVWNIYLHARSCKPATMSLTGLESALEELQGKTMGHWLNVIELFIMYLLRDVDPGNNVQAAE